MHWVAPACMECRLYETNSKKETASFLFPEHHSSRQRGQDTKPNASDLQVFNRASPLPKPVAAVTNYTVGNFPVSALCLSSRHCKGHGVISATLRSAAHQQTGKELIWTVWQDLLRAFGGGGKPCSFPLSRAGGRKLKNGSNS